MTVLYWLWGILPWQAQWGLMVCAALFVAGVALRFKDALAIVKKVAGWPGVAAVVGAVGIVVSVFWPRHKPPPKALKKKRWFPELRTARRTPRERKFNLDTSRWEDAP